MEINSFFDENIYSACVIAQKSSISNTINEIIYKKDIDLTYNGSLRVANSRIYHILALYMVF
jgi:hypothetical protein